MNRLLAAASAAMISLALTAPVLHAEDLGLKQLQDTATQQMAKLNMDTSMVDMLTLDELTRVQAFLSGNSTNSQKVAHIQTVLRDADERIAAGGAVVPKGATGDLTTEDLEAVTDIRQSVRTEIAELGMNSTIDVDALSEDQLMRVHLIAQTVSNEGERKMQIEKIVMEN